MFVIYVSSLLPQNREGCQLVRQGERKEPILSTEEIINAWKNNEEDPNKLSKGKSAFSIASTIDSSFFNASSKDIGWSVGLRLASGPFAVFDMP